MKRLEQPSLETLQINSYSTGLNRRQTWQRRALSLGAKHERKREKKNWTKTKQTTFYVLSRELGHNMGLGGGENRGVRRGGGGGGEEGSKGAFTHRSEQSGALLRRLVD